MKRKTIYALPPFLVLVMFVLFGLSPHAGGVDDRSDRVRGDRQMSFTDSEASAFPAFAPNSRYAQEKRANQAAENAEEQARKSRDRGDPQLQWSQSDENANRSDKGRQSAGQAGINEDLDRSLPDRSLRNGDVELRNGRTTGQMSNVPGTTSTSPNGTANFFGTGGIPIFPEDLRGNGKSGNPD